MTRLTLFIYADGKGVLSLPENASMSDVAHLREAWKRFVESEEPQVLFLQGDVRYIDLVLTDALRIERAS